MFNFVGLTFVHNFKIMEFETQVYLCEDMERLNVNLNASVSVYALLPSKDHDVGVRCPYRIPGRMP